MYNLNEREAFIAMTLFLREFYRTTSGHMAMLITDTEIETDGLTHDPAVWGDWLKYVAQVKAQSVPYDPEVWEKYLSDQVGGED